LPFLELRPSVLLFGTAEEISKGKESHTLDVQRTISITIHHLTIESTRVLCEEALSYSSFSEQIQRIGGIVEVPSVKADRRDVRREEQGEPYPSKHSFPIGGGTLSEQIEPSLAVENGHEGCLSDIAC
jgi:hypothetical protein